MMDEAAMARAYWAAQGRTPFYEASQHWRRYIAEQVARHCPVSVFEFGCNAGRNLVEVRALVSDADISGVDVNEDAVGHGIKAFGLNLRAAGEECLATMEDASIDVVFTVSVLDHVPQPEPVLDELARITRKALVLLEPYTGQVGRSDGGPAGARPGEVLTSVPFTYTWDYVALSRRLEGSWRWRWAPYPISSENMGPYYWLIEGTKRCGSAAAGAGHVRGMDGSEG